MAAGDPVVVVGAGAGGLAAAIALSARGHEVTVLEALATPGGKMRHVRAGGRAVDAGPTVLTMRWIFERLFSEAGSDFSARVRLTRASLLARHAWSDGTRLDLSADIEDSAAAIAAFAGTPEADGYRRFCADSRAIYATLKPSYIDAQRPGPVDLMRRIGLFNFGAQMALKPLVTMDAALSSYFADRRLIQLFGRYATYCGASPFLAPATLMLVAHVEQDGVWLVDGGMHALARTLSDFAVDLGATIRYATTVDAIETGPGGVTGLRLSGGERIKASAIVFNGDVSALATLVSGSGVEPVAPQDRSFSALTFTMTAETAGFPLAHHNVFFCDDSPREFDTLTRQRAMPDQPTTYLCAQDRDDVGQRAEGTGLERMLLTLNAPADGDRTPLSLMDVDRCLDQTLKRLDTCGLSINRTTMACTETTPTGFHRLFPATGGALYGRASHGFMAAFQRPGARTLVPGLYLAGGSAHPGPGVPMATLSGMLAAASLVEDRALTRPYRRAAISGGTSTD